MLTSLYSLFYVTGECYRFLHQGRAAFRLFWYPILISLLSLAYEIASFSQLFRHQDRHNFLNDDVTDILDIKCLLSRKTKYAV